MARESTVHFLNDVLLTPLITGLSIIGVTGIDFDVPMIISGSPK